MADLTPMNIPEPIDLSKLPHLVEINDVIPNVITVGQNNMPFDQWVIERLHTTSDRLLHSFRKDNSKDPLKREEIIEHFDKELFTL